MGMGKDKKTTTNTFLDPQTQGYVDRMRQAGGNLNRTALGSDPWAQAPGDLFNTGTDLLGQMGDQYGFMGQAGQGIIGGSMGGPGGALTQGLGGLGAYSNPFTQQGIAAMIPGYQFNRSMADQAAGQQATRSGAYGGSREAVLRAENTGNIDRNFLSGVNQMAQQGTAMGMNAMMQDRMRNAGNLGLGFQGMQMGAGGMSGLTNQYMNADQYQRQAAQQLAMDPFVRGQAGLGALQGALGPYGTTTENIQKGNFFQDALGLGLTAAGAAFGGPAGAAAGAQLGGLGGSQGGGGAPGFMGNWNNYLPTNMMPGIFNQQPSNALFSGYGGLGGLGGGAQGSLYQQGGGFF